jgi:hypothetical protein
MKSEARSKLILANKLCPNQPRMDLDSMLSVAGPAPAPSSTEPLPKDVPGSAGPHGDGDAESDSEALEYRDGQKIYRCRWHECEQHFLGTFRRVISGERRVSTHYSGQLSTNW